MAAIGTPYENAQAERFCITLQREEVDRTRHQIVIEAKANLETFIADVYNAKRLH